MKLKCIGITGCLFVSMLSAQAQLFEISPFFGYRFGGSFETESGRDTDLEAGRSYGLSLDYAPHDSDIKLELFWSRQDSRLDLYGAGGFNHVNTAVDDFMLGGVYENGRGRLRETATVLLGATVFSPDSADTEARFGLSVGLGVKYFLLRNLALRADLRGYSTIVEGHAAFISSGGRTLVYFSGDAIWQGEVSGGITVSF